MSEHPSKRFKLDRQIERKEIILEVGSFTDPRPLVSHNPSEINIFVPLEPIHSNTINYYRDLLENGVGKFRLNEISYIENYIPFNEGGVFSESERDWENCEMNDVVESFSDSLSLEEENECNVTYVEFYLPGKKGMRSMINLRQIAEKSSDFPIVCSKFNSPIAVDCSSFEELKELRELFPDVKFAVDPDLLRLNQYYNIDSLVKRKGGFSLAWNPYFQEFEFSNDLNLQEIRNLSKVGCIIEISLSNIESTFKLESIKDVPGITIKVVNKEDRAQRNVSLEKIKVFVRKFPLFTFSFNKLLAQNKIEKSIVERIRCEILFVNYEPSMEELFQLLEQVRETKKIKVKCKTKDYLEKFIPVLYDLKICVFKFENIAMAYREGRRIVIISDMDMTVQSYPGQIYLIDCYKEDTIRTITFIKGSDTIVKKTDRLGEILIS